MNRRPDVEDLQTTRTEKLLAVLLAAFLLVAGIWTYTKIDDVVRDHVAVPFAELQNDPAIARQNAATQRLFAAQERRRQTLQNLELRREAYRTALDADKPAGRLEHAYDAAQAAYAAAGRDVAAAHRARAAAAPAADAAQREAAAKVGDALHRQARDTFLARLVFVLLAIAFGFALLVRLRRSATRWYPLAGSVLAFATVMTFVLAGDYVTDYFEPFDWGVAVVATFGIVATLFAYYALERYLARRLPQRRVRRRQCPFCGYPVGTNARCEDCGREVVAPCRSCEAPRRVGTAHCGVCGATS